MSCCKRSDATCKASQAPPKSGSVEGRSSVLATLPAIGAAFIAPAACPCCWATYGGLLGAGFLGAWGGAYLLPLTVVFMALALVVLALGSIKRRSYGPLVLATFAASAVLAGRFWLDWRWLVIAGALSLFAAAVWNAWPRRVRKLTKGVTTATPA